jgi:hypothetical protein
MRKGYNRKVKLKHWNMECKRGQSNESKSEIGWKVFHFYPDNLIYEIYTFRRECITAY